MTTTSSRLRARTATVVAVLAALAYAVAPIPVNANQLDSNPAPRAAEGDLFVPLADAGSVVRLDPARGSARTQLTLDPTGAIPSPYAAMVGPDGLLYVSDAGTGTIERFDPADNDHIDTFVIAPTDGGDESPFVPRGLAFDAAGDLFVVDAGAGVLRRFQALTGDVVGSAIGRSVLVDPVAVVLASDGTLLVSDQGDDDIERFDPTTGDHLGTFATFDAGNGPAGMALSPGGNLFVALGGSGEVVEIDRRSGEPSDPVIAGLEVPSGLALDTEGTLWVSDYWAETVTAYDPSDGKPAGAAIEMETPAGPRLLATAPASDGQRGPRTNAGSPTPTTRPSRSPNPLSGADWLDGLPPSDGGRSLVFEANEGQAVEEFDYAARGRSYDVLFGRGAALVRPHGTTLGSALGLRLRGAAETATARPTSRAENGTTDAITYDDVLPGIAVRYSAAGGNLEYSFEISPGADPGSIELEFPGTSDAVLEPSGSLLLTLASGDRIRSTPPVTYQVVDGERTVVDSGYRRLANGSIGFRVGDYDRSLAVVIDPVLVAIDEIWLTTRTNVSSPSGAPGLDSWLAAEALAFGDPNLALEPGPTDGTFSSVFDVSSHVSGGVAELDGLHYVTSTITVGTANAVTLDPGDLLFSTESNETFTVAGFTANDEDIVLFEPATAGDYTSGTFSLLYDMGTFSGDDTRAITLAEKTTTVGDATVPAGTLLIGRESRRDIIRFDLTDVGPGTAGTESEFADGPTMGFSSELWGLELLEDDVSIGGITVPAGRFLATINNDGDTVGSSGQPQVTVNGEDIFSLDITTTGSSPVAGAHAFFDGSDVQLNTSAEDVVGLTLTAPVVPGFTVNSTGDSSDSSAGDGTCDTGGTIGADPECTLRAAIQEANALAGTDSIAFDIPAALVGGIHLVNLGSALPSITETLTIDATTEPDHAGDPVVRVDGNATSGATGFVFSGTADGSTLRGLMVTRFDGDGVRIASGADSVSIEANWIGSDGSGAGAMGNGDDGVDILGTNAVVDGNVVNHSSDEGIDVRAAGATITGNHIGLEADGVSGAGNTDVGIALFAANTTIGGPNASDRNLISLNWEGIEVNTSNNVIQGNHIGTDMSGMLDRGNRIGDGIEIQSGTGNLVGGTAAGEGNVIAHNQLKGVDVTGGSDNAVIGNSVFANGGLGIDLGSTGITPNDAGDGDSGANELLNFPVITSATETGGTVALDFDLDVPAGDYRIEIFTNPSGADGSGNGEGETLAHTYDVASHPGGSASYSTAFAGGVGDVLTATTTEDLGASHGSTSEFSAAVTVGSASATTVTFQEGTNGYSGTVDTWVSDSVANQDNSADPLIQVDNSAYQQGLIRFDSIIGGGAGQIPRDATITSAQLTFVAADPSGATATLSVHRMLTGWAETDTWNTLGSGVQLDDSEASIATDSTLSSGLDLTNTPVTITGLAAAVQSWVDGNPNNGWLLVIDSSNGWDARSSENGTTAWRPELEVSYVVSPRTYIVNSTGDAADLDPGDGLCDTGGANSELADECTLRAAIEESNATGTTDTIQFAIPTSDPGYSASPLAYTLTPSSQYDFVTDPVTIDARTQPGWSGDPIIELDGSGATGASGGLILRTDDSLIAGFIVHSFPDEGLEIDGSTGFGDNNTLVNNWVGFDASLTAAPNVDVGVLMTVGASGNTIGGSGVDDANVVGFGANAGIVIRNSGSDDNVVIGNLVGVGPDGTAPMPNTTHGIEIYDLAASNRIGGTSTDEANTIVGNGASGVHVATDAGSGNAILGNDIRSNTGLGIDLAGGTEDSFGVTANDASDGDAGPNDLLNFPVITSASEAGGIVTVVGTFDVPAGSYRFELFTNAVGADPSGHGEGQTFVGTSTLSHSGSGPQAWGSAFPGSATDIVTVTITEDLGGGNYGSTSEFSVAMPAGAATVNSTGDGTDTNPGDHVCDTGALNAGGAPECTLRAAIEEANASSVIDAVAFDIPTADGGHSGGVWTISPTAQLPDVATTIWIDGTTQPGWATTPVIALDGIAAGAASNGLSITGDNVEVRGLAIGQFALNGIYVATGASGGVIAGNHLGTDASGMAARGNGSRGIDLTTGSGPTTVGGTAVADRNVISGNGGDGLVIWASDSNIVINNFIGTDVTGNASGAGIGNGADGIAMGSTSAGNIIGQAGYGNVLSGNTNDGLENDATGAGNTVQANIIGLGGDGSTVVANGRYGVVIYNGANNTQIGGAGAGEGNVISGNTNSGMILDGASNPATTANVIAGNYIGTDGTGTLDRGNGSHGVHIFAGANATVIGGATAAHGNVISGNGAGGHAGVFITGVTSANTVVQHNLIGTNAAGDAPIMNNLHGIRISDAPGTDVMDNLISGNNVHGVYVFGSSTTGTEILRNTIGTDAAIAAAVPNGFDGIRLEGSSTGTIIGSPGNGNTVAGNGQRGININDNDANTVQSNWVGTDPATGTVDLGNGLAGISTDAFGSSNNTIGGAGAGEGNTIAFNATGISLVSGASNSILGNAVYGNDSLGIDLADDGVTMNDAGDGDPGPNDLLNFPEIVNVQRVAGDLVIDLTLDVPAGDYRLEVFGNTTADGTGYGEGENWLGATTVSHTGSGPESFTLSVTAAATILTLTATEDLGGGSFGATSELSLAVPSPDLVIVNSTGDGADSTIGDGQCDTGGINAEGDPECTLRAAIAEANDPTTPVDTIWFAVPSTDTGHVAGVWTISPGSGLPAVTETVTIDASTQPGWAPNSVAAPGGLDGTQAVAIDGGGAVTASGLVLDGGSISVSGLVIGGFDGHGIEVNGTGVTVTDVYVGTDASGTAANANTGDGIHITGDSAAIGGIFVTERVLVAGNGGQGIEVAAAGAVIMGSFVGLDASGTAVLPNLQNGIRLNGATNAVVGGPGAGNVVSGNGATFLADGVDVTGGSGHTIQSNLVGTSDLGAALGNFNAGIAVTSATDVMVGGDGAGEGNTISDNGADGVLVMGATADVTVLGNSIVDNSGLAIDLAGGFEDGWGVTGNDAGDGDAGPNDLLNTPVLGTASASGATVTVAYTLDVPAGTYRLDFYANPTGADPSGSGETDAFLDSVTVVHSGAGPEGGVVGLAGGVGTIVTATATEDLGGGAYGPTSEASNAVTAVAVAALTVDDESQRRSDLRAAGSLDPAASTTTGAAGLAMTFDGVDDRLVGPGLDITDGAVTMGAWVRPSSLSGTPRVISKRDGAGNPVYELYVDAGTDEAMATFRIGGSAVTVRGGSVGSGTWHHLLATWDGADVVLYVDGVEEDRVAAVGSLATAVGTAATIGNNSSGAAGFDGEIDHVVVSHQAWSAGRVDADHTAITNQASLVSVGAQQTAAPGAWTVSSTQTRSGSFSLVAPETSSSGVAAWAVATGIDEPGLVFESWWWVSTATGIDLASGTRGGSVPTDELEAALTGPSGWELRHRTGGTETVDAAAAGTPVPGSWVKVELWTDQNGDSRLLIDGAEVTGWTAQGNDPAMGSAALRAGLLPSGESWYIDDPRARKLITPEPVTSLSSLDRN